jgi:hypothetical protein
MAGTPGGKDAMKESVISLIARTPPASLESAWTSRFSTILREGQLASPKEIEKIGAGVQKILDAHKGPARISFLQKYLRSVLTQAGLTATNATP